MNSLWLLNLDRNPVEDVSPLAGLPSLGCVFLSHTGVAFADVLALPRFAHFWCLGIGGMGVADLSVLSDLDLVNLDISDNAIADLEPLAGLRRLRALNLFNNAIADIGPLDGLSDLNWLMLTDNAVFDLSPLVNSMELEQLHLAGNAVSDLQPLAGLVGLERLTLNDNAVSDIGPLANLVELEQLYLNGNAVSDLKRRSPVLSDWNDYTLNDNAVSDIGSLANLAGLEWLYLDGNRVSNLSPLAGMTRMNRPRSSTQTPSPISGRLRG